MQIDRLIDMGYKGRKMIARNNKLGIPLNVEKHLVIE